MSSTSDHSYNIAVLNQQISLPQFAFFQVVKVKSTGEVATIIGMKYDSSNDPSEDQREEWLYLLSGLTELTSVWWKAEQLRSLNRR
ncbi:MAG: hypothetical protein MUC48_26465 [Leptolyngbya sp. Prado105]|nr:hypothetical protein [Leptolyngbya sp. Prado105]